MQDTGHYDSESHSHDEIKDYQCSRCYKYFPLDELFEGSKWIKSNSAFYLDQRVCEKCKGHFEEMDKYEAEEELFEQKYSQEQNRILLSIETINN